MKEIYFRLNKSAFTKTSMALLGKSYLFRNTLDFIEELRRQGIDEAKHTFFTSGMFPYSSLKSKESIRNHIKNVSKSYIIEDQIYIKLTSDSSNPPFFVPLYMVDIETRKIEERVRVIPQGKLFM